MRKNKKRGFSYSYIDLILAISVFAILLNVTFYVIVKENQINERNDRELSLNQSVHFLANEIEDILKQNYSFVVEDNSVKTDFDKDNIKILIDFRENRKSGLINLVKIDDDLKIVNQNDTVLVEGIKVFDISKIKKTKNKVAEISIKLGEGNQVKSRQILFKAEVK